MNLNLNLKKFGFNMKYMVQERNKRRWFPSPINFDEYFFKRRQTQREMKTRIKLLKLEEKIKLEKSNKMISMFAYSNNTE